MDSKKAIAECATKVLALGDTWLRNYSEYTCNTIERFLRQMHKNGELSKNELTETKEILEYLQAEFIKHLNTVLPLKKVDLHNTAFIHHYCCIIYEDRLSDKPFRSPEFLHIRKMWLNFLITGKLGAL